MITFTTDLYENMSGQLQEIAISSANTLQRAEQSYEVIQASLQQLKAYILAHTFGDRDEEILFFKNVKPKFLQELIFYMELYHLEARRPVGDSEVQTGYCKHILERVRLFFERNQSLYNYYRAGKTDNDELFFLRGADAVTAMPEYLLDMDPRFCTLHSFKLGKIQAYEQLYRHLQQEINLIADPLYQLSPYPENRPKNTWTDPKAALIELAYSIHAKGAVNNGNADVKDIIESLEHAFNISLGNYYAVFQNIRFRKKNPTAYLDQLREFLKRRMDDMDE